MGAGCTTPSSTKVNYKYRIIFLVLGLLLYLIFGATVLSLTEAEIHANNGRLLRQIRTDFSSKIQNGVVTDMELEQFLVDVVEATGQGIFVTNNVTIRSHWNFGQSFFFVGTLLTTIGYGHTYPLSVIGKVFTVFYCIVGVPLTFLTISVLINQMLCRLWRFKDWLKEKMPSYKELHVQLIHLAILTVLLVVFIFLIPAGIFMTLEDHWQYFDSIYYCVISLTTIGLGDFVPGEDPTQSYREVYNVATTLVAVVNSIPELNMSTYFLTPEKNSDTPETQRLTPPNSPNNNTTSYSATATEEY
ncbi:hypothetical protein EB796_004974 [Bugula neritina]|uniref:Potassium channel domain-containing protein n=1 Tax=Bugula neritina TaxID=10212 RepID=A0A7J7KDK3_BUGNE|nr:hypothetical protein EB796_004974 [Bugula neritina]